MIEAGVIDPKASRSALIVMAARYIAEQVRKRTRAEARADESSAAQRREKASEAVTARTRELAAKIAHRAATDWTKLLDLSFALPTGERVTWAAATIAQHDERAAMLENMAARDVETAALHREAILEIREAAVDTLGAFAQKLESSAA